MKLSNSRLIETALTIFQKDFLISVRNPAAFITMLMFALTSTAILSLSLGLADFDEKLLSALLWIILFFAASSGISGTFDTESISGTLPTLKLYAPPQAILFGKIFFVIASLILLAIFIVPIFFILFDCAVKKIFLFTLTILLGIIGMATAGTLISALTVSASIKGGLFSVLLFPIILPIFFPAIKLTELALQTSEINFEFLIVIIFYDAVLLLVSSILYDYID